VGELGKLLNDIIPNLHLIIGQQKPVPDLLGLDASNRLNHVFIRVVRT